MYSLLGRNAGRTALRRSDTLPWADVVDSDGDILCFTSPRQCRVGSTAEMETPILQSLQAEAPPTDSNLQIGSSTDAMTEGEGERAKSCGVHSSFSSTETHATLGIDATTLMIRNIPLNITQKDMLKALDDDSYQGQYDFVYMPSSFTNASGKGYAFVNFRSVEDAFRLAQKWHRSHRFAAKSAKKLVDQGLNICAAEKQGLEANLPKKDAPRLKRIRNPNLRPFIARDNEGDQCRQLSKALPMADAQDLAQVICLASHLGCNRSTDIVQGDVWSPTALGRESCNNGKKAISSCRLPLPLRPGLQTPTHTPGPFLLGTLPMSFAHEKCCEASHRPFVCPASPNALNKNLANAYHQQE